MRSAPSGYNAAMDGFLAQGNDVKPAEHVTIAACTAACTKTDACKVLLTVLSIRLYPTGIFLNQRRWWGTAALL